MSSAASQGQSDIFVGLGSTGWWRTWRAVERSLPKDNDNAGVAQLVEHGVPNAEVAGSFPVARF